MGTQEEQNIWIRKVIEHVEFYQKNCEKKTLTIAIDGMSGAGKTTLGKRLKEKLGGNLFHMDDFFLQPHQRTISRLAEPGGNVDYERFKTEIIDRLGDKLGIKYGIYDCHVQSVTGWVDVSYGTVNIIEGSYSTHPYFGDYADIYFFLETDVYTQKQRIKDRNGADMLERFRQEWIPKENKYFEAFDIRKKCICIRTDSQE